MPDFKASNKYSRVCFTINMLDDEDWPATETLTEIKENLNAAYFIAARETAPTTGRKHIQGYLEMEAGEKNRKKGSKILKVFKDLFGDRSIHLEPAVATAEKNLEYCSKDDKEPLIIGEPTGNNGKGTKPSKNAIAKELAEGKLTLTEVAQQYPGEYVSHHKGFAALVQQVGKQYTGTRKLIFHWGKTGTGKTMHAIEEYNPEVLNYTKNGGFFQGYRGGSVVLFDDFAWANMQIEEALKITDRYKHTINIKGGEMHWNAQIVIFTSNDNPREWWPQATESHREAWNRRIDEFANPANETGYIREFTALIPSNESLITGWLRRIVHPAAAAQPDTPPQEPVGPPAQLAEVEDQDDLLPDAQGDEPLDDSKTHVSETDEEKEEEYEAPAQRVPSPVIIDLTGDTDEEKEEVQHPKRVLEDSSSSESEEEHRYRRLRRKK